MDAKTLISELRAFVVQEQKYNTARLMDTWRMNLKDKLESGLTQSIKSISSVNNNYLTLVLGDNESRFREGDMVRIHSGEAFDAQVLKEGVIEAENDGEWLVRFRKLDTTIADNLRMGCYADPDQLDLTFFYDTALDEIAGSKIGINILLPMLCGDFKTTSKYTETYDKAADIAEDEGMNDEQARAVGLGVSAQHLACIQGPPGTGKTRVISLIARLLVKGGEQVLMTSFTHMAINNALNKVHEQDIPVAKVGAFSATKGLHWGIPTYEKGADWSDRPDEGYVIGATPFATCTKQLETFEFDTVIFDEASQITVPLALMAMRKAKRYIFVGDHKQLPPVIMSKSILDNTNMSIFSRLINDYQANSVMLNTTYRMSHFLAKWPGEQFYQGNLVAEGENKNKIISLARPCKKYQNIINPKLPFTFVKSPGKNCKTSNEAEANLVAELIQDLQQAGVALSDIGVVSPFRNHARSVRNKLADRPGSKASNNLVVDTVERMQGQEKEVIIISLCATNEQFIANICDFLFQSERLNVAITRAKTKLILIGPLLSDDLIDSAISDEKTGLLLQYLSLVESAADQGSV